MRDSRRNIVVASAAVLTLLTGARFFATVVDGASSPVKAAGGVSGSEGLRSSSVSAPGEATDRAVIDLAHGSGGMTMAADASGALHVAASVNASGTLSALYARCTDQCAAAASWSGVILAPVSADHVPTIALTEDGRPRITYHVPTGPFPGLHYVECDSECLDIASWHDVWLADMLSTSPWTRPRLPFAVSGGGAAAYAFDDGTGVQLLSCASTCNQSAAWTQTQIAGPNIAPESLAFGSDGGLQVVGRLRQRDTESLLFLDCPAECASAGSWNGVSGLWFASGEIEAQLARTTAGSSRIAIYADDPSTQAPVRVLAYLACDAECATPGRWQTPLLPPIAAGSADVGFLLALDAADNPVLAYSADAASAVSRCVADCTTPAGTWTTTPGMSSDDLDARFPITLPASCNWAHWSMYNGPALTLVKGAPITALTASAKAFEGSCGGGTTLDTVSFVRFGP